MPSLLIQHPPAYLLERAYIYDVLFGEFLGLKYEMQAHDASDTRIVLSSDPDGPSLIVKDGLFRTPPGDWLQPHSLPKRPLERWEEFGPCIGNDALPKSLPVLYGQRFSNGDYLVEDGSGLAIGIDLFGSAFFMLSRYEELTNPRHDVHDRYRAVESVAYSEQFLTRPIVNEYLEVLWTLLRRLWPRLERRSREYRVHFSHDIDHPFAVVGKKWTTVLRNAVGDVITRKDGDLARRRFVALLGRANERALADPFNTFGFLMTVGERYGQRNAFYFKTGATHPQYDAAYSLDHPDLRRRLREIRARGHEIGLHPSYGTLNDPATLHREFMSLLRVMDEENIQQDYWGGRQHYLRWQSPTTWQHWDDVGLTYDTSVGYGDQVGFRCGVCYEFPAFNLRTRQALRLRERPLIAMEATLFTYMGLTDDRVAATIVELADTCRRYSGDFSFLWHNSNLASRRQQRLYEQIVGQIV